MKTKLLFWILMLSIAAGALSAATPPDLVHFQGVLMSGGAPLTGPYDVEFRYWDAPEAGTLLLVEIHDGANAVVVDNGVFQVELGAADRIVPGGGAYDTLAAVFANTADVHLEITVGADPPMQPRVHMAAAAYALNARSLEGKRADEFLDTSETYQVKAGGLQVPFMRAEFSGYGAQIPGEPYPYTTYGLHAYGEDNAAYFEAVDLGIEVRAATAGYFVGEDLGIVASAGLGIGGDFYGSQQGLTVYSNDLGIGAWGDVTGGDFFGGELGLWGQSDAVGVRGTGATMGGHFTHPVEGGEAKLGFGPTGGYFFGTPAIQAEGEIAQLGAAPAGQRSALFGSTGFFHNNSTSVSLARVQQDDTLTETALEALSSNASVRLADHASNPWRVSSGLFEESVGGTKAELAVWDEDRALYGAAGVFERGPTKAYLATGFYTSAPWAGYFDGKVAVLGKLQVYDGIGFDDGSTQTTSAAAGLCTELTGNPDCHLLSALVDISEHPPNSIQAVSDDGFYIQPEVAIGLDNKPIVAYWDSGAEDGVIAHCLDWSCSAFESTTIDELGFAGGALSIVVPLDGNPLVASYSNFNLEFVQCYNRACTDYDWRVLEDDDTSASGLYPDMAINHATGNPLICYYHQVPTELRVLPCTDSVCSSHDSPITLDGAGDVGQHCAIAVPADSNLPIIAYWDATNRNLKAVRCTSHDCSTFDPPMVVDNSGNIAGNTATAIGQDGYPLITYNDDDGHLKLINCEDDACTTRILRTLDDNGEVVSRSPIVVPNDGRPIVSHYNSFHTSLVFTRCDDADCAGGVTWFEPAIELVAPWTAMALGADDKPVIAYQDIENSQIRTITHLTILDEEFKSGSFAAAQSSGPSEESALASGSYPTTRIDETRAGPLEDAICGDRRSDRPAAMERITLVQVNGPAETGDILVIAPEHPGVMRIAQDAVSPAVLGIVAPKPDGTGATQVRDSTRMDSLEESIRDVPVVFSGITLCKVDAGYGEIRPGDLLATSPTPGHAMRVLDPLPGTILGKALEPIETGTGMIKILVTLR